MNSGAGVGALACLLNLLVLLVAGAMTVWVIRGASASNPDGSLLRQSLRMRLFRVSARFSRNPAEAWFRWAEQERGPVMTRACLDEAIRLGHAEACLRRAELLSPGALRTHPEEALGWYRRAAELGSAEGAYRAALELGWHADKADERRRYLEMAASAGHASARDRLEGRPTVPPVQGVAEPARESALRRHSERLMPFAPWVLLFLASSLGLIFLTFLISFILAVGALAPILYALALSGPLAILAVWLSLRGVITPGRASRHTRRLIDQAAKGEPQALFALGSHYLRGGGGHPKDLLEARRCFLQAAEAGHPGAMFELSDLLQWGAGGLRDPRGAQHWLEEAAKRGNAPAQARLQQERPR